MDYSPLISEYANFIPAVAAAFAVVSIAVHLIVLRYAEGRYWEPGSRLCISVGIAILVALGAGFAFGYAPNIATNTEIIKRNVEAKYDVTISNVKKTEGDEDASVFAATIVRNEGKTAYSVMLVISADGTPSIINANGLDATTFQRSEPARNTAK